MTQYSDMRSMSDSEVRVKRLDRGSILTALIFSVALFMCVLVMLTFLVKENQDSKYRVPDKTVIAFLDEYILATDYEAEEAAVEKYFLLSEFEESDNSGRSQALRDINSVFTKFNTSPSGYRVTDAHKDYIEIMLFSDDGSDLPPRIGILYNVTGDKIANFSIFRLQPLSHKDSEWRKEWQ